MNKQYIPQNIEECIKELDKALPPETIAYLKMVKEDDLFRFHFNVNLWIRNTWKLWESDTALAIYFGKLGVTNAEDISSIILGVYWDYHHGKPVDIKRWKAIQHIRWMDIDSNPRPSN